MQLALMTGRSEEECAAEKDRADSLQEVAPQVRLPAHDPAACQRYVQKEMAQALPNIVASLVSEAGKGSVAHTKLLLQMCGAAAKEPAGAGSFDEERVVGGILDEFHLWPAK